MKHDLGWLKRVDVGDGWTNLVDGFGNVAVTIRTENMPEWFKDRTMQRMRYIIHRCQNNEP